MDPEKGQIDEKETEKEEGDEQLDRNHPVWIEMMEELKKMQK